MQSHTLRTVAGMGVAALAVGLTGLTPASAAPVSKSSPAAGPCHLANGISHVVQIQFDNVHLTRDNPNVPSDLEQMPHLLNFLNQNGTVLSNDHTVLSHTATNFIADQTGLSPDRESITQSNSFEYYDSSGKPQYAPSFGYWTDPVGGSDPNYLMDYTADREGVPTDTNVNAPAPWVPFTRGGCDVGEVGIANTVLENTKNDITTVFGSGSPEATEASSNPTKAQADFEGLAVHCAATSSLCTSGKPDVLPDEPNGYQGYKALFGNAEIQPAVSPSGPITSLSGQPIGDASNPPNPGFPGFDRLTPDRSLGYAATLLESGVPVTNVYVSDTHTDHSSANTGDFGPGEQAYEQQLADYDQAFQTFLARMAEDGITPANTLFTVTTDEGDHFSGSAPTPASCTGAPGNYCSYATKSEVNVDLPGLLAAQKQDTTPFAMHSDPAPAIYVNNQPDRTDSTVRTLDRDIAGLTFVNPLTGQTEPVAYQMADTVEEKILHFVGPDGARTPTLTAFSGEDSYVFGGAVPCPSAGCVTTPGHYAWNHGGIWPDMQTIWSAYVGPGIRHNGLDSQTWMDQTDNRPTILALTGLHDDYPVDGRVLVEITNPSALPQALRAHTDAVRQLGQVYKQILAADGQFAMDTLTASTHALTSDDTRYGNLEAGLSALGSQRNRVADQISNQLLGAAFEGRPVDQRQAMSLITQARALLAGAHALATA